MQAVRIFNEAAEAMAVESGRSFFRFEDSDARGAIVSIWDSRSAGLSQEARGRIMEHFARFARDNESAILGAILEGLRVEAREEAEATRDQAAKALASLGGHKS